MGSDNPQEVASNEGAARPDSLLQRMEPSVFAAPMGLLGSAHVLGQLFALEGTPFDRLAWLTFLIGGGVLVAASLVYLARVVRVSGALRADFCDPVKMNFGSAFAIALILGARGMTLYNFPGAREVLLVGAFLSFGLAAFVVRQWIVLPFTKASIVPAWFVPVASTLVASKALADAGYLFPAALIGGLGFFGWLMLAPLIVQRVFTGERLADALLPSLFILIAPPGLAASAILALFSGPAATLAATACFGIGLFFLAVLATLAMDFEKAALRAGYSHAAWALSFPTAALAGAGLSLAAEVGVGQMTLLAQGLAVLHLVLTGGVSFFAVRALRHKPKKETTPAG